MYVSWIVNYKDSKIANMLHQTRPRNSIAFNCNKTSVGEPLSTRKFDACYIFYFAFNLIVAVLIFDLTMIFVPNPCMVGVPHYCTGITNDNDVSSFNVARYIYQHLYKNDRLGFERPTWFMTAVYFGPFLWAPYYIFAIYCFYIGDNRIRIPTIIYCSMMSVIYAMLIAENTVGKYTREDPYSFLCENIVWLITIPMLMIKMLKNDKPFGKPKLK